MENIDAIFALLSSAQELLTEEVTTLHEGGFHNLAREVSNIRYGIERRSLILADLHDHIQSAHAQIDNRVLKAQEGERS